MYLCVCIYSVVLRNVFVCVYSAPYYCAHGSVTTALNACMNYPAYVLVPNLISQTTTYASQGVIDPTSNMANHRVYLFHGTRDSTVNPGTACRCLFSTKIEYDYKNIYYCVWRTIRDKDIYLY